MKHFKEWLSDNLRYVMLLLAVVLLAAVIWIGIRVYQNYDSPTSGQNIEILTEESTERETMTEPETQSETESETQTESETESETQAPAADTQQSDAGTAAGESAGTVSGETTAQTGAADGTAQSEAAGSASQTDSTSQTDSASAADTQAEQQEAAEGVYMTLNQACNFRSGPGYDYEVVAVYDYGTSVEFLGMVEGWAEVRIDGVIGYMGRQFLS